MLKNKKNLLFAVYVMLALTFSNSIAHAEEVINVDASTLVARAEISVTPAQATLTQESIFEVPILLNTKGQSMNAIELNLKFDPKKLSIVKPSTGKSIIGIWVQPPKYDNTNGTASFIGTIPGGIVSNSSLIITITFQAKGVGTTDVRVLDSSTVLANDGVGTQAILTTSRGVYTILPKPPGGLTMYSDTHPFQDHWYNNNSPTVAWNRDPGIIGFSYVLDDKPNTIPDNQNLINETSKSYQNLKDGLWYFHIKALREGGAWGSTTHYVFRIDTAPPAKFNPKVNYLTQDDINRALITFFTTDSLSGIDHYEIGVIDKTQAETSSPLFVRSDSPYQVPMSSVTDSRVIVRAYDVAGNSIDTQISIRPPSELVQWFTKNSSIMLLLLLILLVLLYLTHYLWGHKVLKKLRLISHLLKNKKDETVEEAVKEVEEAIVKKENTINIQPALTVAPKVEPKIEAPKPVVPVVGIPKPVMQVEPKPEVVKPEAMKEIPKIEVVSLPPLGAPRVFIEKVTPQKDDEPVIPKPPVQINKDLKNDPSMNMIKERLSKPVVNFHPPMGADDEGIVE